MENEEKLRVILKKIDALKGEVESLLPKPAPIEAPVEKPIIEPAPTPVEEDVTAFVQPISETPSESRVPDLFDKIGDWLCVRGDFAPKGVTREFAVATRWLLRIGSLLLVGAMAYFITLAINRGWIGPTQRVFGMMFWGLVGTIGGTYLKVKNERYAIFGEVFAALGLVGLYFSFGLGHRYFEPPVIASTGLAFTGLVAATVAAGMLSVRPKSIGIAVLGLFGGFLVPMICRFNGNYISLAVYLMLLSVGGVAVAWIRGWTLIGYAATGTAFLMVAGRSPVGGTAQLVGYGYLFVEYAMILALTVRKSHERTPIVNAYFWVIVTLAAIGWIVASSVVVNYSRVCDEGWNFAFAALFHAALAFLWRKRGWFGEPVLIVLAVLSAVFALFSLCVESNFWAEKGLFLFIVFGGVLAELAVRAKSRTLGVMTNIVAFGCIIGWLVWMVGPYSHLPEYGRWIDSRIFNLWTLPLLPIFLSWRIAGPSGMFAVMKKAYFVLGCLAAFVIVTCESHWFGCLVLPVIGGGMTTIVWAVIASSLLVTGIASRLKAVRFCGLSMLGLSILKILFLDTASLETPARVAVFAAVGVLLLVGAFFYLRNKGKFDAQ